MRLIKILSLLSLATLGLALSARGAMPLSGDYEDEGTVAEGDAREFAGGVSLGAMISMEFDPGLVKKLHAQIGKVRIRQDEDFLKVQILERDGTVLKEGRWPRAHAPADKGYLNFHVDDQQVVLVLETVTEHGILQVTLQRSNGLTTAGPAMRKVGVFLFQRL